MNGEAEIILDKAKIHELWGPITKIWFKDGKDDPTISLIKVKTTTAYCWDTDGNRMINILKMIGSVITGANLVTGSKGEINI